MNILEQVAARFGIKLIGSREPVKRSAVGVGCLFVQRILAHVSTRYGFNPSHNSGSRWALNFLTLYFEPAAV